MMEDEFLNGHNGSDDSESLINSRLFSLLFQIFMHTHDQIKFTDTKAAIILATNAAILPHFLTQIEVMKVRAFAFLSFSAALLGGIALCISILYAFKAIFPLVKQRKGKQLLFEHLATLPEESHHHVMASALTGNELENLLINQIRINSKIIMSKFIWVRASLFSLGCEIAAQISLLFLNP